MPTLHPIFCNCFIVGFTLDSKTNIILLVCKEVRVSSTNLHPRACFCMMGIRNLNSIEIGSLSCFFFCEGVKLPRIKKKQMKNYANPKKQLQGNPDLEILVSVSQCYERKSLKDIDSKARKSFHNARIEILLLYSACSCFLKVDVEIH